MHRPHLPAAGRRGAALTLAFVALIGLVACAAGRSPEAMPADPAAAYAAAREQAAKSLEALQAYELAGTIRIETVQAGGGEPMTADLSFAAAARWPNRLTVSQSENERILDLGTGPDASWFHYAPMRAAYRGAPMALVRDFEAAARLELEERSLFNFYAGLGQLLLPEGREPVEAPVTEKLNVGGRDITCRVFSLPALAADPANPGGTPGAGRWWLDPESGICVKVASSTMIQGRGGPVTQNVTMTLTKLELGDGPADGVFAWNAPEGLRVAATLEQLANPESMVGQKAPDAVLTDLDGKTFNLADLRGKVVFLDLWATWCGPCRMEMPHLEKLHKELGGQVAFVAASSEAQPTIESFLQKNPYTMRIVRISEADAQGRFGAKSIPTGFVIDKEGTIRAHLVGAQSEDQLRRALARAGIGS
ncbi:MAG: TlpA family protein disulfide reductase [bacterium]|nr:TlpA family protein disulfide reductase [bacterium]